MCDFPTSLHEVVLRLFDVRFRSTILESHKYRFGDDGGDDRESGGGNSSDAHDDGWLRMITRNNDTMGIAESLEGCSWIVNVGEPGRLIRLGVG